MKAAFVLFVLIVVQNAQAIAPLVNDYSDKAEIYKEFRNFSDNVQDIQFRQVTTTPTWQELRPGEIVIYVSTPAVELADIRTMLRAGTTVYVSPQWTVIKVR